MKTAREEAEAIHQAYLKGNPATKGIQAYIAEALERHAAENEKLRENYKADILTAERERESLESQLARAVECLKQLAGCQQHVFQSCACQISAQALLKDLEGGIRRE